MSRKWSSIFRISIQSSYDNSSFKGSDRCANETLADVATYSWLTMHRLIEIGQKQQLEIMEGIQLQNTVYTTQRKSSRSSK